MVLLKNHSYDRISVDKKFMTRSIGQVVKTPPSQGGITGSNPV